MSTSPLILLPDTWHFHRRNFGALFDVLAEDGLRFEHETTRKAWWPVLGKYGAFADALAPHRRPLEDLSPDDLVAATHRGHPLADLAFGELMALLVPQDHWLDYTGPTDRSAIIRRAAETDRASLLSCMAAAANWLDFWTADLERRQPSHVLVFSGSYIYTRALMAVAGEQALPCFAMESFFTGNEFYMEPRHTPLANNSLLGDRAYYEAMRLPDDFETLHGLRSAAHGALRAMRNKNVKPRDVGVARLFPRGGSDTVLIIGQVANDFSLIETQPEPVFSVPFYTEIVQRLLAETECNVVFKAHPWEHHRDNLRRPATLDRLRQVIAALPAAQRDRCRLLEMEPIRAVFQQVDHVVALCSQGALEACQAGLKPAMFGTPFFGGKGFTHDYAGRPAIGRFLDDVGAGRLHSALEIEEYRLFEDFLVRALILHMAGNDARGRARVRGLLRDPAASLAPEEALAATNAAPIRRGIAALIEEFRQAPGPWLRDVTWKVGRRLCGPPRSL